MQKRRLRTAGIVAATVSLVGAAAVVTATAHAAAAGCRVTYTISSQWTGGFGANVAVTNLGDPVTSWTLRWSFPAAGQAVTQAWNATATQSGSAVTVTNAGYKGAIATRGSAPFGLNGPPTSRHPGAPPFPPP